MLFKQEILNKIKNGDVRVAFRKWKTPRLRVGGTLLTSIGVLRFKQVEEVKLTLLSNRDAVASGVKDLAALKKQLSLGDGKVFKITFEIAGPDPRKSLRVKKLSGINEYESLKSRLERLDRFAKSEWTKELLGLIKDNPGVGSKVLSERIGIEQARLKLNVRKLKNLGLTISLGTGYKLSLRGRELYRKLQWEKD